MTMIPWNDAPPMTPQPTQSPASATMNLSSSSRRRHTLHGPPRPPVANHLDQSSSSSAEVDEYGYERGLTYDHPPLPPPPEDDPMSPERRARKQRIRPGLSRRGGACHSDLLKSAVLATLESYESEEEFHNNNNNNKNNNNNNNSGSSLLATPSANRMMMDDNSRSSRKRARQMSVDECLLGAMDFCSISAAAQKPPLVPAAPPAVRHVARRTSKELACGILSSPRTNGDSRMATSRGSSSSSLNSNSHNNAMAN